MGELLRIASQMGSSQGGGGDPHASPSQDGKEGKDRSGKKEEEEKKDPLEDNADPSGGDPEHGKNSDQKPKGPVNPPKSDKQDPRAEDLKGVFLAKLPDKVREAVLNGDFDQVPEKYRELVREWTKALSEQEAGEDE